MAAPPTAPGNPSPPGRPAGNGAPPPSDPWAPTGHAPGSVAPETAPGSLPPLTEPAEAEADAGPWTQADSVLLDIADVPSEESARSPAMPTVGHIGRYGLKYRVGEGGLGSVWAAYDPLLSRLIAIKTLHVDLPREERPQFQKLFLNEARAAGRLSHPNIVTVFDAGSSDHGMYIAMELLKGKDLSALLKRGWRPTPGQAAVIARRVADALHYAHSRGVVHRDIKPANIFMVGRLQPRVLDFGIASVAHRKDDGTPIMGSPYYMSPEQLRGEATDRRTDVYSLGVVLYEMLAGERPYGGNSLPDITAAVLAGKPRPPALINSGVPGALADIALRAMAREPAERHASARELSHELRRWIAANPQALKGDADRSQRRGSRLLFGTFGAIGACLLALGAWQAWQRAPADTSPASNGALRPAAVASAARPSLAASVPTVAGSAAAIPTATATAASATETTRADQTTDPATPAASAPPTTTATLKENATPTSATAAAPPAAERRNPPPRETAAPAAARRPAVAEATSAEPTAAAATGFVAIAVSPWAHVDVDGTNAGTTPPMSRLTLPEGRHTITLRNDAYAPHTLSVQVKAGQTVSVRHQFGP